MTSSFFHVYVILLKNQRVKLWSYSSTIQIVSHSSDCWLCDNIRGLKQSVTNTFLIILSFPLPSIWSSSSLNTYSAWIHPFSVVRVLACDCLLQNKHSRHILGVHSFFSLTVIVTGWTLRRKKSSPCPLLSSDNPSSILIISNLVKREIKHFGFHIKLIEQ